MGFSRKGMWTHIPVPATETVFHAVTLLLHFLIHGSSRYHPKTGFPPLPSATGELQSAACALQLAARVKLFSTIQVFGPFRLAVPSPSFPT